MPEGVEVAVGRAEAEVGVAVERGVKVEVAVKVGEGDAVAVPVMDAVGVIKAVNVGVKEFVGVEVACATVTVAPGTGRLLNNTACPLVPLPAVTLNV